MMTRQSLMHGWAVLFFGLTAILMLGLPAASLAATEDTVASAAYGMVLESATNKADYADASLLLVAEKESHKKMRDCPSVEVDEHGKPVGATEKGSGKLFFPCLKVSNGQGGYKCSRLTPAGTPGCNDCPSCQCTETGAGPTQNCVCQ